MSTAVGSYFEDGYTELAQVAAVPRVHPGVRFSFRPALNEECSLLASAAATLTPEAYERPAAEFTAAKIVSWDLPASDGRSGRLKTVPVSAAAVLRLPGALRAKLHAIVIGACASDIDPGWSPAECERQAEFAHVAASSGRTLGEVREEHDLKNWSGG